MRGIVMINFQRIQWNMEGESGRQCEYNNFLDSVFSMNENKKLEKPDSLQCTLFPLIIVAKQQDFIRGTRLYQDNV